MAFLLGFVTGKREAEEELEKLVSAKKGSCSGCVFFF